MHIYSQPTNLDSAHPLNEHRTKSYNKQIYCVLCDKNRANDQPLLTVIPRRYNEAQRVAQVVSRRQDVIEFVRRSRA